MGATKKSFAWLNAFVADPHYRMLRLASMATFRNLDRPLKLGITWGGYLNWARDEIQAPVVRANAEMLGCTFPVRWLGAEEIAALPPELRPGPVSAGLFSGIDGHLDPVHVTRRFLDRAGLVVVEGKRFVFLRVSEFDGFGDLAVERLPPRGSHRFDHRCRDECVREAVTRLLSIRQRANQLRSLGCLEPVIGCRTRHTGDLSENLAVEDRTTTPSEKGRLF